MSSQTVQLESFPSSVWKETGIPSPDLQRDTGSDRLSVVELKSVGETHLAAAHTGIGIAKVFIADLAPGPILSWMTWHRGHLVDQ